VAETLKLPVVLPTDLKAAALAMPQARLTGAEAEKNIAEHQIELERVLMAYLLHGVKGVVALEGWDAAGKGGLIRRITATTDPRGIKVWPIAAPDEHERKQHYLQRFWSRMPGNGAVAVFDRSWYGRVLVERVEGFTAKERWSQAYDEINAFEKTLTDDGVRLVKIFLHITPEEQLKRFEKRFSDPLKRWKLTYEDFRNRDNWAAYEEAISDMLERTSTPHAPWVVIPANDKDYTRSVGLEAVVDGLSRGVDLSDPPVSPKMLDAAKRMFGKGFVKATGI
jgi:AMP-polyphosphate phosphotransferase